MSVLLQWPPLDGLTPHELFRVAWDELGRSVVYLLFFHPGTDESPQLARVLKLCKRFNAGRELRRDDTPENRRWWREFLSEIADEVENLC